MQKGLEVCFDKVVSWGLAGLHAVATVARRTQESQSYMLQSLCLYFLV